MRSISIALMRLSLRLSSILCRLLQHVTHSYTSIPTRFFQSPIFLSAEFCMSTISCRTRKLCARVQVVTQMPQRMATSWTHLRTIPHRTNRLATAKGANKTDSAIILKTYNALDGNTGCWECPQNGRRFLGACNCSMGGDHPHCCISLSCAISTDQCHCLAEGEPVTLCLV